MTTCAVCGEDAPESIAPPKDWQVHGVLCAECATIDPKRDAAFHLCPGCERWTLEWLGVAGYCSRSCKDDSTPETPLHLDGDYLRKVAVE